jgi:3-deoxy-7-phosphoheptulonate synthase
MFTLIAGPCAVESHEQTLATAHAVAAGGAAMLRGSAYMPRTTPHSFQGLGRAGLEILAEARAATGLPIVTELVDVHPDPASALCDGAQALTTAEFAGFAHEVHALAATLRPQP